MIALSVADYQETLFVTDFGLALLFAGNPTFTHQEKLGRVLDLGCGCGVYSIVLQRLGFRQIVVADINRQAVQDAKRNIEANHCDLSKISLIESDLYSNVDGQFDLIITNTSHLPALEEVALNKGIDLALLGGPDGRKVLDGVLGASRTT